LPEHDGDGSLGGGLVEGLTQRLGKSVDYPVVTEENVVRGVELALGFVLPELGPELGVANDAGYARSQLGGEFFGSDNVLVGPLGVGGNEAYRLMGVGVQRVRKGDLGWLQPVGVDDVALGGEGHPDGGFGEGKAAIVLDLVEDIFLLACFRFLLGSLLDVAEESLGRLEGLQEC